MDSLGVLILKKVLDQKSGLVKQNGGCDANTFAIVERYILGCE